MKDKVNNILQATLSRYPVLQNEEDNIIKAFDIIVSAYRYGGKLLICGNGGSAADADHIVGELMKGFLKKRPLDAKTKERLLLTGLEYKETENLQVALPAINLSAHASLMTATMNDLNGVTVFAQQVLGFGKPGDILLGISTSGNSKNVILAGKTAKALGLETIGLTGATGGEMTKFFDIMIRVPETETFKIQELHLPVYHTLCAMIEEEFFDN